MAVGSILLQAECQVIDITMRGGSVKSSDYHGIWISRYQRIISFAHFGDGEVLNVSNDEIKVVSTFAGVKGPENSTVGMESCLPIKDTTHQGYHT